MRLGLGRQPVFKIGSEERREFFGGSGKEFSVKKRGGVFGQDGQALLVEDFSLVNFRVDFYQAKAGLFFAV